LINDPLPKQLKRLLFRSFQKVSIGCEEDFHRVPSFDCSKTLTSFRIG
jgi:hypothetical protein